MYTFWEGCTITQITNLANNFNANLNNHNTIKPSNFPHYAKILYLIEVWFKQLEVDMQEIIFEVVKFEVFLQPGDLYCSDKDGTNPVMQH